MTQREGLEELARRCEAATGADRELDAAIYMAVNPKIKLPYSRPLLLRRVWPTMNGGRDVFWYETKNGCSGGIDDCPYTVSLDAAMTLVPEGWGTQMHLSENGQHPCVILGRSYPTNARIAQEGHTLPATVCAAALYARATLSEGAG